MMKFNQTLAIGLLALGLCSVAFAQDATTPVAANASVAVSATVSAPVVLTPKQKKEQTVKLDLKNSVINWKAEKIGGGHNGTIKIKSGDFRIKNGFVSDGWVKVDLSTFASSDLSGEDKTKLETHIKSADFLDVIKFKEAEFFVTNVKQNKDNPTTGTITGRLKMKNISLKVTFDAAINFGTNGAVTLTTSSFRIDRTKWGVKWGSSVLGSIKEGYVKDLVDIQAKLVGKVK